MTRIETYLDQWLDAFKAVSNTSAFAREVGRSHATFAKTRLGLGPGGFNPTYQLLKDSEPFLMPPNVNALASRNEGSNSHDKAYLPLVGGAELDGGLYAAHRYLEQIRAERRRLRESDIDFGVLGSFVEKASDGDLSVHLATFSNECGASSFDRWDTVAEYRNGRDFTGARIDELGDSALTQCLHEDFEDVVHTGWPQIAALHRRHDWQADGKSPQGRVFLRYMCRLEGVDDRPKILSLRSLQKGRSACQLIQSVFPS